MVGLGQEGNALKSKAALTAGVGPWGCVISACLHFLAFLSLVEPDIMRSSFTTHNNFAVLLFKIVCNTAILFNRLIITYIV